MKDLKDIFEDIFTAVEAKQVSKDVDVVGYKTIHEQDREAVTVISPSLEKGPWIAGGACLRWYQGMPVGENDIDVFCKDAVQAAKVIEQIKSFGRYSTKYESDNATTLSYGNAKGDRRWTLQVITRRYFNSLKDVIDNFDITVCEIGTCGNEWELGAFTARDIREKNLRFKLPLQADAVKRLTKYWTYGYRPVEGTLDYIINNPTSKWEYAIDEDYNNAF